jgi:hypothetical protein
MEMETAFHFHAATMTATDLFLLQLPVASSCAGTISQSGHRKDTPFILQRDVIGAFLFAASPDPTRVAQNGAAKDTISASDLTSFWSVF